MSKSLLKKIFVLIAIVALMAIYKTFSLGDYLSLEALKEHQSLVADFYLQNPSTTILIFSFVYVTATTLSIPGAVILTLAGGAIFGLGMGTVIVSLASTLGATLAFVMSRLFFREPLQRKFQAKVCDFDRGFKKDGPFYLFTLRLVPIFPFFLVNLLMGLTPIPVRTYFWVSQLGMLPGTIVYVNAGTQIAKLESMAGILSPNLLASFVLIGILPLTSRWITGILESRRNMRHYSKPKKFDYNMVVIGAGSAGLVSAYIASAVKAKVALIERHKMGGDCLNTGCVPSKALIRSAKVFSLIKRADEFGLIAEGRINFAKLMERVQGIIKAIEPHDSVERYTNLGVDCIEGSATIVSPYEVKINDRILTTQNLVIATGARPLIPNIPGLDACDYLTSDTIWNLRQCPKRLVVLGGGPIGCELAHAFARLGSQVTLIEMGARILGREDEDVAHVVSHRFQKDGINLLTAHKALSLSAAANTIYCDHNGKEVAIEFDQLLIALGRKPNIEGWGAEQLGIRISPRGTIETDQYLRATNFPNIFACGDVAGPYQFTHTAAHQAWYVAVNALFRPFKKFPVDYRVIPWCTFTDPEVARVGLNEQEAKALGIEYDTTRYDTMDLDRAIAEGEDHGFVKVLTAKNRDKILGVTIVGEHAGEIISEFVLAMKHGLGLNKILGTIHIYPTFAEANKYAAGVWRKNNAPQKVLKLLAKYHTWRRG